MDSWHTLARTGVVHHVGEPGSGITDIGCTAVYTWTRYSLRRPRPGDHICGRCARSVAPPAGLVQLVNRRAA